MSRCIPLALAAASLLAGCVTPLPRSTPERASAISAAAATTAAVLDAIGEAPPPTLTRTTIDDRAIRVAFVTFDKGLTVIGAFLDSGQIKPGSPAALRLRGAVLATQAALNAASAAQRAGSAATYSRALSDAQTAITNVQLVLAGQ